MGRAPNSDKNGLKKGPWTSEEDQKLVEYIKKHGYGNWRTLPKNAGLERCGKSCRLRWTNYLRPDIKRGKFTFEEEETIIQLHSILGNKWSCIAARLPGRTDNEIKNYWNTHIRKKLLRMGIDPVTHNPRLDLLDVSTIITSSLFNPSQMNMSRLLGIEPFVNPELLKLATSILSSSTQKGDNNQTMFVQNVQENDQMSNLEYKNQFDPIIAQSNQTHEALTCNNFTSEETHFGEQFSPSTLINFGSQSAHLNECQQSNNYGVSTSFENQDYVNQDYVNQVLNYEYYDGSEQIIMDNHQYDNSNFKYSSNDSNQDFSFTSIFSTPSSTSPTLTEDERETSYCSNNMLKFETQDNIFDHVNEFIM